MATASGDIIELATGGELKRRMESLFSTEATAKISVGISLEGEHFFGGVSTDNSSGMGVGRLGCITKLLTAALLKQATRRGSLELRAQLATCAPALFERVGAGDISLSDLLNHTHGLDDSNVSELPTCANGYIDSSALCALLFRAGRISLAGRYYSYGHAGAWLGAAILESIYQKRYREILESELLAPMRISLNVAEGRSAVPDARNLCPAFGRHLTFTCEEMLRFLDYQMTWPDFGFKDRDLSDVLTDVISLPGWHSTEQGVYFGWKYYGCGWFGHNSQIPRAGMLVRMNPARGIGIVVISGRHPPVRVARRLFRDCLPELISLEMPKLRQERSISGSEAHRYLGNYRNCAMNVSISVGANSQLMLRATREEPSSEADDREMCSLLRPGENGIFFLQTLFREGNFYIQFLGPPNGAAEALWNGVQVIPRVPFR